MPLQVILDDPLGELLKLSNKQLKVLNYLLFISLRYDDIYPRQDTIAKYARLSVKWVNETIAILVSMGVISKEYRANHSCLYRVSSFFSSFKIRQSLKKILGSLSIFSLSLLTPGANAYIGSLNKYQIDNYRSSYDIIKGVIYNNHHHQSSIDKDRKSVMNNGNKTSDVLDRIVKDWGMDGYERKTLEAYDDKILIKVEEKMKTLVGIRLPKPYFIKSCYNESILPISGAPKTSFAKAYVKRSSGNKDDSPAKEHIAPAYSPWQKPIDRPSYEEIKESWNRDPVELGNNMVDKLSKIDNIELRKTLSTLFNVCHDNYNPSPLNVTDNASHPVSTPEPSYLHKRFDVMASKYKPFVARRPVELVITSDMANAITLLDKNEMGEFLVETMRKIEDYEVRQRWYQEAMNIWNVAKTVVLPPISEEDEWFNQQQPMDIDDYDPIQ